MKKAKYKITWSFGLEQGNLTKTEALKAAADLLNQYDNVVIAKQK